jgi:hypothetical protein
MNSTILDSLDYYYSIKNIYSKDMKLTDKLHNLLPVAFIKEGDTYIKKVYNLIGLYIPDSKEFIWAWNTNIYKYLHTKTNQIILHGINMEALTISDFYIKKILTTGNIRKYHTLDIILALACYLTKAHAYSVKYSENKNYAEFYVFYDIKDVEGLELEL